MINEKPLTMFHASLVFIEGSTLGKDTAESEMGCKQHVHECDLQSKALPPFTGCFRPSGVFLQIAELHESRGAPFVHRLSVLYSTVRTYCKMLPTAALTEECQQLCPCVCNICGLKEVREGGAN